VTVPAPAHAATVPHDLIRRKFRYGIAAVAVVFAGVMMWHHYRQVAEYGASNQEIVFIGAFGWLLFMSVVPYFHRDVHPRTAAGRRMLDRLIVNVTVPVHNEDPAMFRAMLDSISAQTRLPQRVHVVENGYPQPKLEEVFDEWQRTSCPKGVQAWYSHILEPSKRVAQFFSWVQDAKMEIIATVDSDVQLDPGAIKNGIAPFVNRRVHSVCGMLIGLNHKKNLITRLVEPSYVTSFLGGRAAFSMVNSVNVNCGALAFYRADTLRKYLDHYMTHTIAGRTFSYGDDAMTTRYALLEGQTVFQSSSWAYTLHPENLRHLTKQRVRWWRSYFWGNVWLLRTFSPRRLIWWLTAGKFTTFAWYSVLLPYVLFVRPVIGEGWPTGTLVWVLVIGAFAQARYLSIRRPDESLWSTFGTFLLAPLGAVLNVYLCWGLQYVGLFTCLKTGWSTRKSVEVGIGAADEAPAAREAGQSNAVTRVLHLR
jgi:hyaluronan synthase